MSKRHCNDVSTAFPRKEVVKAACTGAEDSDKKYGTKNTILYTFSV